MKLHIVDEFSPLQDVVVCWGDAIPEYEAYSNAEPEFTKYHKRSWDHKLLLKQQEKFFACLEKYHVRLHFPKTNPKLHWQMYTRDVAFAINDTLYFSAKRPFSERNGEIQLLQNLLKSIHCDKIRELTTGSIEGGDVVVNPDHTYIGNGSRTEKAAIDELATLENCKHLFLGENVMHLDTRFTILSDKLALVIPETFQPDDLAYIKKRFTIIPVLPEEAMDLTTNVFMVNPETVISAKHNVRINAELKKHKLHVEEIDYTEPINLGGSFRCTTLPLVRV